MSMSSVHFVGVSTTRITVLGCHLEAPGYKTKSHEVHGVEFGAALYSQQQSECCSARCDCVQCDKMFVPVTCPVSCKASAAGLPSLPPNNASFVLVPIPQ